jgi:hypothetical protein
MEILENCDVLPLAVKLIGGLLITKYPTTQVSMSGKLF